MHVSCLSERAGTRGLALCLQPSLEGRARLPWSPTAVISPSQRGTSWPPFNVAGVKRIHSRQLGNRGWKDCGGYGRPSLSRGQGPCVRNQSSVL